MSDILIVLAPASAPPRKSDFAAVGFGLDAAGRAGGSCDVLLLGPSAREAAAALSGTGLRTAYAAGHADLAAYTAEAYAAALERFLAGRSYRLVGAATSSSSREFFPRAAARLGVPMASDVLAIESLDPESASFTRAVFVGNLRATVELSGRTAFATCRASEFEAPRGGGDPAVEEVAFEGALAHPRKRFVSSAEAPSARPDLGEADIVVSAGRGTKGPGKGLELVEELADLLGAAVGATRAVVDANWLPNELQVGQTGKIVAPKLYIAVGVSGAIQHLAGMRNSKTIVAINKDPDAPIFEVADLGLVADLFEALPAIIEIIKEIKTLRKEP